VSEEMEHTSSASSTSMVYSFKDVRSFLIFCKEKEADEVEMLTYMDNESVQ
jgi:hypothetical protein